ncbi:MAG: MFS transporter [Chloroflexi bacterium]|nr:MFS transporter [Chloroflexota bacterium]
MLNQGKTYPGWRILAAVSGMNFANGATTIAVLTVFILPFADEFGWSRTEIAGATSIGALLGAAIALLTGRLTDSIGARIPLVVGGLMVVVAMAGLAAMQTLIWFYVAFGLARLADQGFIQPSSAPAISKWFLRHRGRALAILFFVTSVGGVVLPLVVQVTIDTVHWRAAWLILAVVMLIVGVLLDKKLHGPPAWVVVGVIVFAMTTRCWTRSAEWRHNGTLYAAAYRDQPDAVGPLQLYGRWLTDHDEVERGIVLLNRVIEIDLGYTDAHRSLGRAYLRGGRVGQALRHLQIAEMQAPGHTSTSNLLKSVSSMLSRRDDALERLREAVLEHPEDVAIELDLVKRLRDLGLLAEALDRFTLHTHIASGLLHPVKCR